MQKYVTSGRLTNHITYMTDVCQASSGLDIRRSFVIFLRAAENPFRPQKTQRLLLKLAVDSTSYSRTL